MSSDSVADQLKQANYPSVYFATSKDGQLGVIPQEQAEQAKASGYTLHEPGVYMTDPTGKLGLVPQSQAGTAQKKGYTAGLPQTNHPELYKSTSSDLANEALKQQGLRVSEPSLPQPKMQQVDAWAGALRPGSQPVVAADQNTDQTLPWDIPGQVKAGAKNFNKITGTPWEIAKRQLKAVANVPLPAVQVPTGKPGSGQSSEISPEQATAINKNILNPVGEAAADFGQGMTTAESTALLGAGRLRGANALARTISTGANTALAAPMVPAAGQKLGEGVAQAEQGNYPEATKNITGAAFDTAFASDMGRQMLHPQAVRQTSQDVRDLSSDVANSRPVQAVASGVDQARELARKGTEALRYARNPEAAVENMSPEQLATKATKPRNSINNWQGRVSTALADARAASDSGGYQVQDLESALKATTDAKKQIWGQYQQLLGPNKQFNVDATPVADAMESAITPRFEEQNPDAAQKIRDTAAAYRGRQMSLQEIEDYVQSVNNELSSYYAKTKVPQRVAARDPEMGSTVAEANTLRSLLNGALENLTGRDAANIKQRYGNLTTLEDVLTRRINVADRQAPNSLAEQLGLIEAAKGAGKGAVKILTGRPLAGAADIYGAYSGYKAAKGARAVNDSNYLISKAFEKASPSVAPVPFVDGQYMPEPGSSSPLVPRFLRPALPASSRDRGIPEQPNVDAVDNREYGDSVTPLGSRGEGGTLVRPKGQLPEGQVLPPVRKALPPISLFSRNAPQRNNVEAVGMPETAEASALQKHYMDHPDVPGAKVVGLDADSGLPIVKRPEQESKISAEEKPAPTTSAIQQSAGTKEVPNLTGASGPTQERAPEVPKSETGPAAIPSFLRAGKQTTTETLPGRAAENVRMVPTKSLLSDPAEMQWRIMPRNSIDPNEPFDQAKAGPIDIWYNPDRNSWQVVDGHHRFNHAMRTGTPEIEARVQNFDNVKAAKTFGAMRNIENGNATPYDAALYFRESGMKPEDMKTMGVNPNADLVQKASSLSHLSNQLWEQYRSGNLDEAKAIAIGQHLSDPSQQRALADLAAKNRLSASEIEQAARRIQQSGSSVQSSQSLFGSDEKSVSNFVETARVASKIEKQLQTDKTALRFIANAPEARRQALARADNIINVDKSSQEALIAANLSERFRRLQNLSGPVSQLLDEAGTRITRGENRNVVYNEIYPKIREAILKEVGGQGDGTFTQGQGPGSSSAPKSASRGQSEEPEGPVTPEGAGDLFKRGAPDTRPFHERAAGAEATFHPPSGSRPSRVALNDAGIRLASDAYNSDISGVRSSVNRAQQIVERMHGNADSLESTHPEVAEQVRGVAAEIQKAIDHADPEQGVVLFDRSMPESEAEETVHAGQAKAGSGVIESGVPHEAMHEHPTFQAMADRIQREIGDKKLTPTIHVAEAYNDLVNDEAPEVHPDEVRPALEDHYHAVVQKMGTEGLDVYDRAVKAMRDIYTERGNNVPQGVEDAEQAIEAVRSSHRGSEETAQRDRSSDGRGQSGKGEGSDDPTRSAAGPGKQAVDAIERPKGYGLDNQELESWVTSAHSIHVQPAGEQNNLFGEPEKMFRLIRSTSDGMIESTLVTESQYNKLKSFKPFKQAEIAGTQGALYSPQDEQGEILGSQAKSGITLPPQATKSQGTLFRAKGSSLPKFLQKSVRKGV